MNIIVAGSRDFRNYSQLKTELDLFLLDYTDIHIVCGEARGADALGRRYAIEHSYPVLSFPAEWDKYGKAAGARRNLEMAKVADALIVFWDGLSKGTQNMIGQMQKLNKPYKIIRY